MKLLEIPTFCLKSDFFVLFFGFFLTRILILEKALQFFVRFSCKWLGRFFSQSSFWPEKVQNKQKKRGKKYVYMCDPFPGFYVMRAVAAQLARCARCEDASWMMVVEWRANSEASRLRITCATRIRTRHQLFELFE